MRCISSCVFVLILCGAKLAGADDAAKAAEHIANAKKAFAEAHYADAIAEFRAANALQPDPKLLYSIAQAQRMSGDCAGAITTYQELVDAKSDPKSDPKLVEFSEANIARCKEQLAKEPPPKPKEPEPPKPSDPVTPAPHDPAPRPIEPHDTGGGGWKADWIGHGLVGGGVGVAVVGTVLFVGGRNAAKAVNDAPDHQTFLDKKSAASSAVAKQAIGIAMAVAGAGLVAGGVIHYKRAGKREVTIGAAPAPGGGAIAARVTF